MPLQGGSVALFPFHPPIKVEQVPGVVNDFGKGVGRSEKSQGWSHDRAQIDTVEGICNFC